MKRMLHKALSLLLTAAVLCGSLLPPAVCHAHVAGDQAHTHSPAVTDHRQPVHHDHKSDDRHSHDANGRKARAHHHPSDDRDRESTTLSGVEGTRAVSAHLHLSLIGIAASLLVPTGNDSDALQLQITSLLDDVIPAGRVALPGADDATVAAPQALDVPVETALSAAARLCVRESDRGLLCDSARRERSGVLLI